MGIGLIIFGVFVCLTGLLIVFFSGAEYRLCNRKVMAVVTSCEKSNVRKSGGNFIVGTQYTFGGREYKSEFAGVDLNGYTVGNIIKLRCDPDEPQHIIEDIPRSGNIMIPKLIIIIGIIVMFAGMLVLALEF